MRSLLGVMLGLVLASGVARAQEADVRVESTVQEEAAADTDVTFTSIITNGGPDLVSTVTFVQKLDSGLTRGLVGASGTGLFNLTCDFSSEGTDGPEITCTLTDLDVGGTVTVTIGAHVAPATPPGTYLQSIATITSATDPNSENDSVTATLHTPFPPQADLYVSMTSPDNATPGDGVVYLVEVGNGGPDAADSVTLTDSLPAEVTFAAMSQTSGPTFSCTSGVTVTCELASMPAGAVATFQVIVEVNAGTDGASAYNQVNITSANDPNSENNSYQTGVCIQDDQCAAGHCNGNVAVVCETADVCHAQGTCQTGTGVCTPNAPLTGPVCDDNDLCSGSSSCQAGVCTGADLVVCAVADTCHTQGTCDPGTGVCGANDPLSGNPCDDGDLCTQTDNCLQGTCLGMNPVVCQAAGPCRIQSTCDTGTGTCPSNKVKPEGTPCDDGSQCTHLDACEAGECVGAEPVVCTPAAQCEVQGACAPDTGDCAPNVPAPAGTGCDDGNACTTLDSCQAGGCQGGGVLDCSDGDSCTTDTCDPVTGCHSSGSCDGGVPDAPLPPVDAGVPDAPLPPVDAAVAAPDAPPPVDAAAVSDARSADAASPPDAAAAPDARLADAGPAIDAPVPDARVAGKAGGSGCSCRAAGGGDGQAGGSLILVALFVVTRVRRRLGASAPPSSASR